MGSCGSGGRSIQRKRDSRCDIEPADTESLKNVTLPILAFYVLLSDVKVKKCYLDSIGLKFRINGIEQYSCPQKQLDIQAKAYWKIVHTFDFMMNEYELRKKFLIVEAINRKKEVIGMLKINVYTIWVGPYHLDFSMELKGSKNCRISFNFRISQGLHFKLDNAETEFIPAQPKIEGTRLTYTMETLIGQKTEPSNYVYHVCIDQKETLTKGLLGNFPEVKGVKKDCIKWVNIPGQPELPRFNDKIAFYQIYSSSVHFNFWRVLPGFVDQTEPRYELQGECFIPISKLMSIEFSIIRDPVTNISYIKREIELTQKVWLHGKEIGRTRIKLLFLLQTHQRQMQSCVRTQEGILTSTPVFSQSRAQQCQEITALNQINTNIQNQFIHLDETLQQTHNHAILKEIITKLYNLLEKLLGLLLKSSKESLLFYNYKNQMSLMKAQRFFIDFAFKVMAYIHEDIADLNQICWRILSAVLQRGQFKLSHMGFSKFDRQILAKGEKNHEIDMKIEVGLKYFELLNELLKQTLKSLQVKGETAEQIFAEKYCAYAYFRIPLFREHILAALKQKKDPQLPQWRGTENNLYEEGSSHDIIVSDDFYQNLFDWQHNFYKPLASDEQYKHLTMQIQTILLQDRWKLRLAHRHGAFFTFLENLVKEIQYVSVVSKHIKWYYLPGYNRLLHAFLTEMKVTKIKNYTERFKKCSIKLLSNQKLLNVMIVLLLQRSNVNDPQTVSISFEMIDDFFKAIKKNDRPIPGTFDYKFLLMGMKVVLQSQFEMSITQVLLFIYDNFAIFSQEFCLQLSLYLLTKQFYRFFFHWSNNLRQVFHALLYAKISRFQLAREDKKSLGRSRQISETGYITGLKLALRQRYEGLLQTIAQEIEPQAPGSNLDMYYDKELYKKMKHKLLKLKNKNKKQTAKEQSFILCGLSSTKSLGTHVQYVPPKKLLFFLDEEIKLREIQQEQMGYVKIALGEYNALIERLSKMFQVDPHYSPQIKLKKLRDEAELNPPQREQW